MLRFAFLRRVRR